MAWGGLVTAVADFGCVVFGLLGAFVLLCAAWRLLGGLRSRLGNALQAKADREIPAGAALVGTSSNVRSKRLYVHHCITFKSDAGSTIRGVILALIVASVICFILRTRAVVGSTERLLLGIVEAITVPVFTLEFALRLWVCVEERPDASGWCPRLLWVLTDPYALLDLVALLSFYVSLVLPGTCQVHFSVLRICRAMQILQNTGAGFKAFAEILTERSKVLVASFFAGAAVWFVCSSFYHYFDVGNPAMVLCPLCEEPDDKGSCRGDEELASCFGRMDTIPSAMYFCLVNLFGEFPFMQEHSLGSKCIGVFIAIAGNALVGIATGVIGNGFADYLRKAKATNSAEKQGDAADAATDMKAYVDLPDNRTSAKAKERAARLVAALDDKEGAWATLCWALAIVGWILVLLSGHVRMREAASLDAGAQQVRGGDLDLGVSGDRAIMLLGPFQALAAASFAAEYAVRLAAARRAWGPCAAYGGSALGIVDFLAFAPVLLVPVAPEAWVNVIWPIVSLARTLKLERYVGAFAAFRTVLCDSSGIFAIAGITACVLWVSFSSIMWFLESGNPLEEVRSNFESVPKAMWMTLLHLSGESPVVDYSVPGKIVTGFIGVFAVSVFSIPFGLMSDGFQGILEEGETLFDASVAKKELMDSWVRRAEFRDRVAELVARDRPGPAAVARFLKGGQDPTNERGALLFEKAVICMIFASVGIALLESTDGFVTTHDDILHGRTVVWGFCGQAAERCVVAWFGLEFLIRLYAAPADRGYWSRRRYLLSFCGFIDILSVAPFVLAQLRGSRSVILDQIGTVADAHDEELRLVRVFRLLLLGNYSPSLWLIGRVLNNPQIQKDLLMALFVASSCLLFFATLLHFTELANPDPDMATRFHSILSSAPFTLIHLTGDYPLTDYTLMGRLVNVMMIVVANGMVGVAGGVVASGFTRELQGYRALQRERRYKSKLVLGQAVRRWLSRRRWRQIHDALRLKADKRARALRKAEKQSTVMFRIKSLMSCRVCKALRIALIVGNIVAVLLESVPSVRASVGQAFDSFEFVSILLFTAEYLGTLYCAPVNKEYALSRQVYAWSFFGFVDLVTILPHWLKLGLSFCNVQANFYIFRVIRSLRILQLEDFVRALSLLDDTWRMCKDSLVASGLIALILWLLGGVLFFEFERGNEALEGAMDSVWSALHYTAVFTAGEWALIDFTPAGKVLCMFYCVLGIGIFAIPAAGFFEAFEASISAGDD